MISSSESLIYIPDITGFTEFVNSTEIEHGQHIISELIEIIIDSDQLGMQVSEVEGDAVLFYAHKQIPTKKELWQQTQTIFINFHAHLKRYNLERICECGACANASGLSLKFIAHAGEIGFTTIKQQKKPYGAELVLSHKLLKNDIEEHEYLLLSEGLDQAWKKLQKEDEFPADLAKGKTNYNKLGVQFYDHVSLKNLYSEVPEPVLRNHSLLVKNPVVIEKTIESPAHDIFEVLQNLGLRAKWNKGINKLEFDENKVNRLGTKHKCLFNGGYADFETITNDFGADKLVYGEKLESIKVVKELSIYYILVPQSPSLTVVHAEIHAKPLPVIGWLIIPLLKKKMSVAMRESLESLKSLIE